MTCIANAASTTDEVKHYVADSGGVPHTHQTKNILLAKMQAPPTFEIQTKLITTHTCYCYFS
jgi:hypothetical protein